MFNALPTLTIVVEKVRSIFCIVFIMAIQKTDAWRSKLADFGLTSDSLISEAFDSAADVAQVLEIDLDVDFELFWRSCLRTASADVAGIVKVARSITATPIETPNTSSFMRALPASCMQWAGGHTGSSRPPCPFSFCDPVIPLPRVLPPRTVHSARDTLQIAPKPPAHSKPLPLDFANLPAAKWLPQWSRRKRSTPRNSDDWSTTIATKLWFAFLSLGDQGALWEEYVTSERQEPGAFKELCIERLRNISASTLSSALGGLSHWPSAAPTATQVARKLRALQRTKPTSSRNLFSALRWLETHLGFTFYTSSTLVR